MVLFKAKTNLLFLLIFTIRRCAPLPQIRPGETGNIDSEIDSSEEVDRVKERNLERKRELCPLLSEALSSYVFNYKIFYDSKTKRCYESEITGPCAINQIFRNDVSDITKIGGECICMESDEATRPILYHENTEKCYSLYTQANCPAAHWLVWDAKKQQPKCLPNPCIGYKVKEKETPILFNGNCTVLHREVVHCPENHILEFSTGSLEPFCVRLRFKPPEPPTSFAVVAFHGGEGENQHNGNKKCSTGTHRSFNGNCIRSYSW